MVKQRSTQSQGPGAAGTNTTITVSEIDRVLGSLEPLYTEEAQRAAEAALETVGRMRTGARGIGRALCTFVVPSLGCYRAERARFDRLFFDSTLAPSAQDFHCRTPIGVQWVAHAHLREAK